MNVGNLFRALLPTRRPRRDPLQPRAPPRLQALQLRERALPLRADGLQLGQPKQLQTAADVALTSTQQQGQCRKDRESWGLGSVVTRAWVGGGSRLGYGVQGARVGVRLVGLAGLMGWTELEKYLGLKLFGLFG